MQSDNILTYAIKQNLLTCPAVRCGGRKLRLYEKEGGSGALASLDQPVGHVMLSQPQQRKKNSLKTKQTPGIPEMNCNQIYTSNTHSSASKPSGQIHFSVRIGPGF